MGSGALRLGCNWHEKNPARQGGKGCRLSLPRLPHPRRAAVSMGSDTSYNEQALLLEAVRFVWAVTCVRAGQPAFMRRHMAATASMGSGALCVGCNWHEKNPARQGGKGCRLSLPARQGGRACGFNPPAFMRTCRIRGVRGSYGKRCVL